MQIIAMMAVIVVVKELALDHVQITARIHALGIAKVDVLQVVQIAMVALIVVVAIVAAALGAIHHVIQVLMHNLVSSLRGD